MAFQNEIFRPEGENLTWKSDLKVSPEAKTIRPLDEQAYLFRLHYLGIQFFFKKKRTLLCLQVVRFFLLKIDPPPKHLIQVNLQKEPAKKRMNELKYDTTAVPNDFMHAFLNKIPSFVLRAKATVLANITYWPKCLSRLSLLQEILWARADNSAWYSSISSSKFPSNQLICCNRVHLGLMSRTLPHLKVDQEAVRYSLGEKLKSFIVPYFLFVISRHLVVAEWSWEVHWEVKKSA